MDHVPTLASLCNETIALLPLKIVQPIYDQFCSRHDDALAQDKLFDLINRDMQLQQEKENVSYLTRDWITYEDEQIAIDCPKNIKELCEDLNFDWTSTKLIVKELKLEREYSVALLIYRIAEVAIRFKNIKLLHKTFTSRLDIWLFDTKKRGRLFKKALRTRVNDCIWPFVVDPYFTTMENPFLHEIGKYYEHLFFNRDDE
jgi:hypothetical protein